MARVTHVAKAQQRYEQVPVIDPETGRQKTIEVTVRGKTQVRRLTQDDRSKPLPPLRCEKCGKDIEVGTPYKWVKPVAYRGARGHKRTRHEACPSWRPSELTSSAALGILYAAQEAAEDALAAWTPEDGLDAAEAILNDLAEGVREAAAQYESSADNMESGFGGETSTSAEIREKQEALEGQADEVEAAVSDLPEDFDEDQAKAEAFEEAERDPEVWDEWPDSVDDYDWDEDLGDLQEAVEETREAWADSVREAVQGGLDQVEGV